MLPCIAKILALLLSPLKPDQYRMLPCVRRTRQPSSSHLTKDLSLLSETELSDHDSRSVAASDPVCASWGGRPHAGQEALCTYTSWYAYAAMFGSLMIQRVHHSPYVQCQTPQALVLPCFVDQNHRSAMLPQGSVTYYDLAQRLAPNRPQVSWRFSPWVRKVVGPWARQSCPSHDSNTI